MDPAYIQRKAVKPGFDFAKAYAEAQAITGRSNLYTQNTLPKEPEIKKEPKDDAHPPAPAPAAGPRNRYSSMTNSGPRAKREREAKEQPTGARPHAPPEKKARKKGPTASGKLRDTRTLQTYTRSDVSSLHYILTLIRMIETAHGDVTDKLNLLRRALHEAEFRINLCYQLVEDSKLLNPEGLASVVGNTQGRYPYDLVDDCQVLITRWSKDNYDPHLLRGVQSQFRSARKQTKEGISTKTHQSRNLEANYEHRLKAHYLGAGELVNGQWWPYLLCAVRDGAHGAAEAGIFGTEGKGAFSIVLGSAGYSNIDNGDTIEYCGTPGANGKESARTRLMMESHRTRNPVRVLRSGGGRTNGATTYRPAIGLRYDGLYEVTGDSILDVESAMHRFTLSRLNGQTPIRWAGVEARPTPEELKALSSIREKLV